MNAKSYAFSRVMLNVVLESMLQGVRVQGTDIWYIGTREGRGQQVRRYVRWARSTGT